MNRKRIAGISLLFVLILSLSFIFGCSAKQSNDIDNYRPNEGTAGGFADKSAAATETSKGSSSGTASNSSGALTGRKVIFSASLTIESTDYNKSIGIMEKMIVDFDGYIQDSSVETSASAQKVSKLRRASYVIRIPVEKLKPFLEKVGDIGNVILNNSKGEDVTASFYDLQAHLNSLKIQEERLLVLLKTATVLQDIINLEDRLTQVRYQIEQLTGSLNKMTSLIDLSTVTITINEVETITAPKPTGFWAQVSDTFVKSIQALIGTLRTIALMLVAIFPFILVVGLIGLAILLIRRKIRRKKRLAAKPFAGTEPNRVESADANNPEQPKQL